MFPLPLHGLASDEVLCKMVGQLAGFPHESLVLQVPACYLLIDVLQAHEERPVAKPAANETGLTAWLTTKCNGTSLFLFKEFTLEY